MDIKALRAKTGLSQAKFSEKYGIPERTVQDWEAGRRTPPEYVLDMLTYIIEDEKVNHTAWVFNEYRDSFGNGDYKLFGSKETALNYAKNIWLSMCDNDRQSYLNDKYSEFWVAELPVMWDDFYETFEPDFSGYTPIWDAIAENKAKPEK